MAKKRKKSGVRWVGPAKLVAESQDAAYGGGGGDAGMSGHSGLSGMGFTASGAKANRPGGSKKAKSAPAPKPKKKK